MRYGSVCSGIEAASVAWEPLGWEPAFFSEIEEFPREVLKYRFPGVPLHPNSFVNIKDGQYEEIDLLVGGTPCQDFSVAGLRAGFNGDRGNLSTGFVYLAAKLRPRWVLYENVPGILSVDGGRGFAEFLGLFTGTKVTKPQKGWKNSGIVPGYRNAYGVAWRILDAQYVRAPGFYGAVPQRRRRLFLVGYLGDWRRAAAVLLESESLSGNPPPGREKREKVTHGIAPSIGASGRGFSRAGETRGQDPVIAFEPGIAKRDGQENRFSKGLSPTLRSQMGDNQPAVCFSAADDGRDCNNNVSPVLRSCNSVNCNQSGQGQGLSVCFEPRSPDGHPRITGDIRPTLNSMGGGQREPCVAQTLRSGGDGGVPSSRGENLVANPLTARMHKGINTTTDEGQTPVVKNMTVRRLMPVECERLMGFPDGYTQIPWRGKDPEQCPDGHRYKALGNSMAVNVMRWIGYRINLVETMGAVTVKIK